MTQASQPTGECAAGEAANVTFEDNTYAGPWQFWAYNQGGPTLYPDIYPGGVATTPLTLAQWQSVWGQDTGSTIASATTTTTDPPATTTTTDPPATTTTTAPPATTTTTAPPNVVAPGAPSDVAATVAGSAVTLSWINQPDTEGVYIYRDGVNVAEVDQTSSSYVDTDSGPGQHSFFLTAFNAAGESSASNVVTVIVPPGPIVGLTATVNGSTVTLDWTNPVGSYGSDIYRDGAWIPCLAWLEPTLTTFEDDDVAPGLHQYTITSWNGGGQGATATVTVDVTAPSSN
jgi:hypothetical protein